MAADSAGRRMAREPQNAPAASCENLVRVGGETVEAFTLHEFCSASGPLIDLIFTLRLAWQQSSTVQPFTAKKSPPHMHNSFQPTSRLPQLDGALPCARRTSWNGRPIA
jgi:hypothetical protein